MIKERITVPRIIISSIKGKGGKTLATVSLMQALSREGYRVSAFKNGPDFIDPGYHREILKTYSRNLDYFLMGDSVAGLFYKQSKDSDIALIEGNHGLYDSIDGISEDGSTAQMAKLLGAPVLVVIDGERMNRTIGAIVRGLIQFDHRVKIIGVILTNIIPRQYGKIKEIVEAEGIPVLGVIYRNKDLANLFKYRHLGLQPVAENGSLNSLEALNGSITNESFRINEIMKLAREEAEEREAWLKEPETSPTPNVNFGILTGKSFTFYYPETIERASLYGNLKFIDPESSNRLPGVDALIIGGGFPEIYAQDLEKNKSFRNSVRDFADKGGTIYAECGGLMYLTNSIVYNKEEFDFVGLINGTAIMMDRPVAHGYSVADVLRDNLISRKGETIKGHEFHHSKILLKERYEFNIEYKKGTGIKDMLDGIQIKNAYAHYMHLHPETHDFVGAIAKKLTEKESRIG